MHKYKVQKEVSQFDAFMHHPRMTMLCLKATSVERVNHVTITITLSTLYTLNTYPRGQNFTPSRSTTRLFRDTRLSKIGNTPNDPRTTLTTYNCHKHPVYIESLPPRPKFHSVSLYELSFSRYKVVESRKCTEWPQNDLNHLTFKSTLYTLNTYLRGQNFTPSRSMASRFRDTRLSKIGNAQNDPRMTLST